LKRTGIEQQRFMTSLGASRWANEVNRRNRVYDPRRHESTKRIGARDVIVAPQQISIYQFKADSDKYSPTLRFLREIERRFMVKDCYVDFSETTQVTAAAMVVVYAALDLARRNRTGKADVIWSKKSAHVNTALRDNNVHKLIRGYEIKYALDSVTTMPIVSSVGSEQMEEIVDFIQKRIYKEQMSPDTEHAYGDAVSETINNVRLHAYPELDPSERRWWLTCMTMGKMLYLAIYDNGVGIPRTVVDRPWFLASMKSTHPDAYGELIKLIPGFEKTGWSAYVPRIIPDEKLIYLSMQGDVSGTKKDKHGQGSKSIMALVSETAGGKLWVFSNKGLYTFNQADMTTGLSKLPVSFPGTLVQWNIELP
jgi:hypothetical protein